jgi:hypothetical protein
MRRYLGSKMFKGSCVPGMTATPERGKMGNSSGRFENSGVKGLFCITSNLVPLIVAV